MSMMIIAIPAAAAWRFRRVLVGVCFHGVLAATWSFERLHTPLQTQRVRIDYTEFSFLGRPAILA